MLKLGDLLQDTVTGLKGIAVARTEWLNGCNRITIQPLLGKDGKVPDTYTFDEPQLVVIKKQKVKKGKSNTGGPLPFKVKQNSI
ncbi:MAG: hypothetical protein IPQ08_06065 [Chitinophagaceae bacterium]|nr:hypothetical protein [Chitinophagaceae bacterium]